MLVSLCQRMYMTLFFYWLTCMDGRKGGWEALVRGGVGIVDDLSRITGIYLTLSLWIYAFHSCRPSPELPQPLPHIDTIPRLPIASLTQHRHANLLNAQTSRYTAPPCRLHKVPLLPD